MRGSFPSRDEVVGTTIVVLVRASCCRLPVGRRPGHRAAVRTGQVIGSWASPRPPTERQWYIVHTYSGFEERVRENLRQRIEALGMGDNFGEIKIPTETLVEIKGGKKRETQRKFFPGYILVEMDMADEAWHLVKNTPKVTGFVGTGKKPTPLRRRKSTRSSSRS